MDIKIALDKLGEFITCMCDREAMSSRELEEIERSLKEQTQLREGSAA